MGLDTKRFPVENVKWEDEAEFSQEAVRVARGEGGRPIVSSAVGVQWENGGAGGEYGPV